MDCRVDKYIANSREFARPILEKVRKAALKSSSKIEETINWNLLCWEQNGLVAGVGAFKAHVCLPFFKGDIMNDSDNLFDKSGGCAIGSIKSSNVKEMPTQAVLVKYIKQEIQLNESGVKAGKSTGGRRDKKDLKIPFYFLKAVKKNKKAFKTFDEFSYTHQSEYVEWVTEAKREETREKRLATTVEWLSRSKSKNWKYR